MLGKKNFISDFIEVISYSFLIKNRIVREIILKTLEVSIKASQLRMF